MFENKAKDLVDEFLNGIEIFNGQKFVARLRNEIGIYRKEVDKINYLKAVEAAILSEKEDHDKNCSRPPDTCPDSLAFKELLFFVKQELECFVEQTEADIAPPLRKSQIPDTDFIQGKRTEGFKTSINKGQTPSVRHYFTVKKGDEEREYTPFQFLDLILECHYLSADETEDLNQKISSFINAESTIRRYIRDHNLKELGYDFSKIFDDLNDVIHRLKAYKELGIISSENTIPRTKLKWLGKPEQFGFIFSELAKKGYIEIPATRGESSYAKYAKTCFELFDFANSTSADNLERALNPNKNQLSESNRAKFSIPEISDIS